MMDPRVRFLMKQLISLGRQHPTQPLSSVRSQLRKEFNRQRGLEVNSEAFLRALAFGEYCVKELEALISVHKFRAMRKYDWDSDG